MGNLQLATQKPRPIFNLLSIRQPIPEFLLPYSTSQLHNGDTRGRNSRS